MSLSSLKQAVLGQLGSLDSPLFQIARVVQDGAAASAPQADVAGSDAATRSGHLDHSRPASATDIAAAKLQVPGDVDHERAKADAAKTLASIDFSKPDIAIWVPATGSHSAPKRWTAGVQEAFGDRASITTMDYPASTSFNDSVSTGMETLRLVMQGIAERGGNHRVTLGGHSQGAWVIGDTIADPAIGRQVDKAVLYGHPSPARVDWNGGDPNVRQVDDPRDPFTQRLTGVHGALGAIDDLADGRDRSGNAIDGGGLWERVLQVGSTVLQNPAFAAYLVGRSAAKEQYGGERDPHHYETAYADGARFLAAR